MRIVIQRVKKASVSVENKIVGQIQNGLLLYIGIEKGDSLKEVQFMADKITYLRIFPDEENRMNLSIRDIDAGGVLSISQFTLASHIQKGRRPDFNNAMDPDEATVLYNQFNSLVAEVVPVETGVFGAMMDVESINWGPVTFVLEKKFLSD